MFDFNLICEFSRSHCVAICAFLVPANLVVTSITLGLVTLNQPRLLVKCSVGIASLLASLMVVHVAMWFMAGVVMIPTYVLLWLSTTCWLINLWAIARPTSLKKLLALLLSYIGYRQTRLG